MNKPVNVRIAEFCNYHKTGDGECNGVLLRAYADEKHLTAAERFDLAYFFAVCYCIPSAILMFNERDSIRNDPQTYAERRKSDIIFQSDRKYVRCRDCFVRMLHCWRERVNFDSYIKATVHGGAIDFDKAFSITTNWYFFGRFGAFLFIETLCRLCDYKTPEGKLRWEDGDTATSGLFNVFGADGAADFFDKTDKLPRGATQEKLDALLKRLLNRIRVTGGSTSIAEVETSLCAYRKFYKGTRYNGFYLDRQLEELNALKNVPQYANICSDLFALRAGLFDKRYLGEVGGWKGIRKECKTLYKRTGEVM